MRKRKEAAQEAKAMKEGLREYRLLCGKDYVEGNAGVDDEEEVEEERGMDLDDKFLQLIGPGSDSQSYDQIYIIK